MDHILYQILKINLSALSKNHETPRHNPLIRIYIKRIENRITFKIKSGYYPKLLIPKIMELLGSIE